MRGCLIIIGIIALIITAFSDPLFFAILMGVFLVGLLFVVVSGFNTEQDNEETGSTNDNLPSSDKKASDEETSTVEDGDYYGEDDDFDEDEDYDDNHDDELFDGDEIVDDDSEEDDLLDGMSFTFDSNYDYDANDLSYDDEYGLGSDDDLYDISEDRKCMHLGFSSFYSVRTGEKMVLWKNGLYYPESAIHEMPKSGYQFLDSSAVPYKVPVRRRKKK